MSKKAVSEALEQEVAASFLLGERRYDHREFLMEFNRVGLKFIKDKVDPVDHRRFSATFDELVGLGCSPETLAGTLYCFCKSYVDYGWSFPPTGGDVSFPPDKEVEKYRDILQCAYEGIKRLEDYGVMEVVARHAQCGAPPQGREQVLEVLRWYIDSLPIWWVPRKDIVQSSAPIACCMYPKIATGKFQFSQVYKLLRCFGYKPDPKRQTKTKDRPRGTPLYDDSLERNYRNFQKAHPTFCDQLEAELKSDHARERERRVEEYEYWVLEKKLPDQVFHQIRINRFDWNAVFSVPQLKKGEHSVEAMHPRGNVPNRGDAGAAAKKKRKTTKL